MENRDNGLYVIGKKVYMIGWWWKRFFKKYRNTRRNAQKLFDVIDSAGFFTISSVVNTGPTTIVSGKGEMRQNYTLEDLEKSLFNNEN